MPSRDPELGALVGEAGLEAAAEAESDFPAADPHLLDAVAAHFWHAAQQGRGQESDKATVFDAADPPEITVREYLERLATYADCSAECFVLSGVYVERSGVAVTPTNVHRLLLAGLILAAKWRDDFYFCNDFYSLVGGVSAVEINRLEIAILQALQWNALVQPDAYEEAHDRYLSALESGLGSPVAESMRTAVASSAASWYDACEAHSDAWSASQPSSILDGWMEPAKHRACWKRIMRWLGVE